MDSFTEEVKPRRGDIVLCSIGCLGLITCDEPQEITYADGSKWIAWTGIHLLPVLDKNIVPGDKWSSRHPKIVGNSVQLLGHLKR